jgi:hypothetical protein
VTTAVGAGASSLTPLALRASISTKYDGATEEVGKLILVVPIAFLRRRLCPSSSRSSSYCSGHPVLDRLDRFKPNARAGCRMR